MVIRHSHMRWVPEMEYNALPSLTVPDQSYSVLDLFENVTKQQRVPIFDPEAKLRDPRSYSILEIAQMRRELEARKNAATEQLINGAKDELRAEIAKANAQKRAAASAPVL